MNLAPHSAGALLLTTALATLTGCGSAIQNMEVRDDLAIYRKDHPVEDDPTLKGVPPLHMVVATTPNLTATLPDEVIPPGGHLTWNLAPLDGDEAPKSMKFGLLIRGGGAVVEKSLEDHLSAASPSSSISFGRPDEKSPEADVIVTPVSMQILENHQIKVTLRAVLKDGTVLSATGMGEPQSTSGHLGWAIPCVVIFFPVSLLWVPPTVRSIGNGVDEKKYAEGAELASIDLVNQLAHRARTVAKQSAPSPAAEE